MKITNSFVSCKKHTFNNPKAIPFQQSAQKKEDEWGFYADKRTFGIKNRDLKTIGEFATGTAAAVLAFAKRKQIGSFLGNTIKGCENKLVDVTKFNGIDVDKYMKDSFLKNFIEPLKNPSFRTGKGEQGPLHPSNGYLVYGPDSNGKEQYFNWMIEELQKAGAEIVDPGEGQKVKYKEVSDAWWKMWDDTPSLKNESNDPFKQYDGNKYKAFVVRGLDEIGQRPNAKKIERYPEGGILKDSPDTDSSCQKYGVMLFYTCKDPKQLDPAVIRTGRIDVHFLPQPLEDEPLETWKDYLKETKYLNPDMAVRKIEMAKEALSKRGEAVMKEMEPHFAYSIPYQAPKYSDSIKKWADYVKKTSQDVNPDMVNIYLRHSIDEISRYAKHDKKGMEKFNQIRKMTDDLQTPEYLPTWRKIIDWDLSGEDFRFK